MLFKSIALLSLVVAGTATPVPAADPNPYFVHGQQDTTGSTWTKLSASSAPVAKVGSMSIKRSPEDTLTHPVVRQIQKMNHAHRRHAKRLDGPARNYKRHLDVDVRSMEWMPVKKAVSIQKRNERRHRKQNKQNAQNDGNDTATATNQDNASKVAAATRATQTGAEVSQVFTPATAPDAGSIALNEDGKDITYFSEINVGSKGKLFTVVLDTGSSDLWVPAIGSTETHSTLARGDSDTLLVSSTPYSITYGSGQVSGVLIQDSVSFAGFNLNTTFGASTFVSSDFDSFIPDGILGLATTKASNEQVTVPVQQLAEASQIPAALFGVHLQRAGTSNDGAISFGAADTKFIEGGKNSSVTFSDNISAQGLWEIALQDMQVDGKTLGLSSATTAIIDTGTTLMIVPPADANIILAALSTEASTNGQGSFTLPCNTTTSLTVKFGGQTLDISSKDYVGQAVSTGSSVCTSNIIGQQIGGANQMLLGDVFLKNVYSVFDLDNNKVGFAPDAVNNAQ